MRMLFWISVLPIIIIGNYIYQKDKNKEPKELLIKLFIGGIGSCFITLFLSIILKQLVPYISADASNLSPLKLLIHVYIGVGLIEEFSKWIIVYLVSYNNKEFDEFYDMVLYAVFVSLGFAAFENILYVFTTGPVTGIFRAILSVPVHAWIGVFMGYYLGLAKINELNGRKSHKTKNIILSILVPMILHGTFDYCLYLQNYFVIILYFIFVVLLYIFALKKIKIISSIERKMKYKNNYCPNCGTLVKTNYCPNCGIKND